MFLENLSFAPYGLFVWSAFVFTFLSLFILYKKVKKEFIAKEKLFLSEYKPAKVIKIASIEEKKYISGDQVY